MGLPTAYFQVPSPRLRAQRPLRLRGNLRRFSPLGLPVPARLVNNTGRMRIVILLFLLAHVAAAEEETPSAFRFKKDPKKVKATIDLGEVMQGVRARGDPRDVIPSIRKPVIVPARAAHWILPQDRVLGVVVNGEARAYPLRVLELHEMVNDVLGGVAIGPNY